MLAVLLDPEQLQTPEALERIGRPLQQAKPDLILIGGSTWYEPVTPLVQALRTYTDTPLVLFPGHPSQFSAEADAILFHTLLSGRNPDTLIGWQTAAARAVHESGIEVLPMAYILVEGGKESTTARVTNTQAIPADQVNLVVDTAIAGELLGQRFIYLEAGSGAHHPASAALIREVRKATKSTLIVGGGITSPEAMQKAFDAGADIVVVGNYLEAHPEELECFVKESRTYNL